MTRTTNYTRPIHLALKVLKEAGVNQFPVNLRKILHHYRIMLITYNEHCAYNECSLEECIAFFGKDGATIENDGKYVIVYNEKATPQNRIRFTIAHELGHIFLGHHRELGQPILKRMWVDKSLYDVLEDEANCFARNLLCPAPAVQTILRAHGFTYCEYDPNQNRNVWHHIRDAEQLPGLPPNLTDFYIIRQSFQVTDSAAKTRCHFVKEDLRNSQISMAAKICGQISFSAQWRCRKCGALRLSDENYCYNCGSKNLFSLCIASASCQTPIIVPYNNYQFSLCPVCGNDDIPPDSSYCTICGNTAANPCIPWRFRNRTAPQLMNLAKAGVVHLNPPGCRYCLICGAVTLHGNTNQIPLYSYLGGYPEKQGGLPTVKYGPNIPCTRDGNGYRVQKCPKCLNEDNESDAQYCIMCGTNLTNICDGMPLEYGELDQHSNPANARFCRCCGKPTAYSRLKILPDYRQALKIKDVKQSLQHELVEMNIDSDLFWKMQEDVPTQDNDGELPF